MKNYHEEWTIVINKAKYVLTEEQASIIKKAIKANNRGVILFPEFSINIPFIEEFYMSRKIYDVHKQIAAQPEKEITPEEKERITKKIQEVRDALAKRFEMPGKKMTLDEVNTRRNKLLDQADFLSK